MFNKEARAARQVKHQFDAHIGTFLINGDVLQYSDPKKLALQKTQVAGASADYDVLGQGTSRMTATRVAAGAVLAGPVGAVVGAVAKKDTSEIVLSVTLADGSVFTSTHSRKDEAAVRNFVAKLNAASEYFSQEAE